MLRDILAYTALVGMAGVLIALFVIGYIPEPNKAIWVFEVSLFSAVGLLGLERKYSLLRRRGE